MERNPQPPCLACFKLIEDVEKNLFDLTGGALAKIEEFFLSIGWMDPERIPPRDPQLDDAEADAAVERYQEAAYANRSRYTELVDCKIPDTLLISPDRRRELTVFAESIHATSTVTCSVYIENVLLFILDHTRGDEFNACVKLIFYGPMKERYRNFMAYTESRESGMSGPSAMNNFRSFMSLSHALIMKKIHIPILEQEREMPLIHIIFFLTRMYITIRDLLQKIVEERGSGGIDIQVVSDWFNKCNELKKIFGKNIAAGMRRLADNGRHLTRRKNALQQLQLQLHGTRQDTTSIVSEIQRLEEEITATKTTFDNLNEKFEELGDETKPLIDIIRHLDQRMAFKSQPGTPQRQGGGRYKRVKKSKKYKKNSKSKKYKNGSKSKNTRKKIY
jgi:uncharacterized protein YoxC